MNNKNSRIFYLSCSHVLASYKANIMVNIKYITLNIRIFLYITQSQSIFPVVFPSTLLTVWPCKTGPDPCTFCRPPALTPYTKHATHLLQRLLWVRWTCFDVELSNLSLHISVFPESSWITWRRFWNPFVQTPGRAFISVRNWPLGNFTNMLGHSEVVTDTWTNQRRERRKRFKTDNNSNLSGLFIQQYRH